MGTISVLERMIRAALVVGILGVMVKAVSFFKEMFVATLFGVGDYLDAFLIAFALPQFVINVVAGALGNALLPVYVSEREHRGEAAAQRLFLFVCSISMLGMTGIALAMYTVAEPLMHLLATGFDERKLHLTISLFREMLPCMVVGGLCVLWATLLNAMERFALATVAPVAVPVVVMMALVFSSKTEELIYVYALAVLGGMALQLVWLGVGLRRLGMGMSFSLVCSGPPAAKRVGRQFLFLSAGGMLMSGMSLVDQAMAAMLEAGSVSMLAYGEKLVAFVTSIGGMAVGTSVFPYFSRMVAGGMFDELRHALARFAGVVFLLSVFVMVSFLLFAKPIVSLAFERGAFTAADSASVADVLFMYAWQIPSFMVAIVFVRLISALGRNHVLMYIAIIGLPLNIVLNCLLMSHWGVAGIALATSLVYFVNLAVLWFDLDAILNRKL